MSIMALNNQYLNKIQISNIMIIMIFAMSDFKNDSWLPFKSNEMSIN